MYQYINPRQIGFMKNDDEHVQNLISQFNTWVPTNGRVPSRQETLNLALVAGQLKYIFMYNEALVEKYKEDIVKINTVLNME